MLDEPVIEAALLIVNLNDMNLF